MKNELFSSKNFFQNLLIFIVVALFMTLYVICDLQKRSAKDEEPLQVQSGVADSTTVKSVVDNTIKYEKVEKKLNNHKNERPSSAKSVIETEDNTESVENPKIVIENQNDSTVISKNDTIIEYSNTITNEMATKEDYELINVVSKPNKIYIGLETENYETITSPTHTSSTYHNGHVSLNYSFENWNYIVLTLTNNEGENVTGSAAFGISRHGRQLRFMFGSTDFFKNFYVYNKSYLTWRDDKVSAVTLWGGEYKFFKSPISAFCEVGTELSFSGIQMMNFGVRFKLNKKLFNL
ncbi:MAG: hypothetical protein WCW65_02395 [Candidatus Paceibacterota bacterium]